MTWDFEVKFQDYGFEELKEDLTCSHPRCSELLAYEGNGENFVTHIILNDGEYHVCLKHFIEKFDDPAEYPGQHISKLFRELEENQEG